MKFTISARGLVRALRTCNDIAPASSVVAEEKTGVLIQIVDNYAVFKAADDNNYISVQVPVQVKEGGEALVKAQAITASVVASYEELGFDGEPNLITIETTNKNTLKLTGANRVREGKAHPITRNFPLLNVRFFAEAPAFDPSKSIGLPALSLIDGFGKVGHAASRDASKLQFNCINLTLSEKEIIFAATDGIQIAEFRKETPEEVKGLRGSFVLGLKFAAIAAASIDPNANEYKVDLYVDKDQIFLRSGNIVLVGALVKAAFPDYTPFMRTDKLKKALFPREDFISVLSGIQPTMDAKSHRVVIDANTNGTATISTSSSSGEAESTGLDVSTPENFNLHFDANLLVGAIRQLRGEEFEFHFVPDASGVLVKSSKDEHFKCFICTLKKIG